MNLIAISGRKGHGKNTAAIPLEQAGFRPIAFADPVRRVAQEVYGLTMHEMLDPVLKELPIDRYPFKSPREILQQIGTEMFRAYEPDTWIEAFERACAGYSHVVCSDLRFLNEAGRIREMGGKVIKIVNPRVPLNALSDHASEKEIDQIEPDWTIYNEGSVRALQIAIADLVGVSFS